MHVPQRVFPGQKAEMEESGGGQRTTLSKGPKLDRPTAGPKASPGGLAPLWGPLGSYMRGRAIPAM